MFLGIFNRRLKVDAELVETFPFNEVSDCSQTQISTILGDHVKPK
jgi:hypothetical protein